MKSKIHAFLRMGNSDMSKPLLLRSLALSWFLVLSSCFSLNAQDVYKTISGDIAVSINYGDTIQLMVSHDLLVQLNYENSKITLWVPYETFRTGVDSIDEKLKTLKNQSLEFTGKLGITINTRRFDQQKYNLEGHLTNLTPPVPVFGNGTMTCMAPANNSTPACTLLLGFETTLTTLHLSDIFPRAINEVRVDLRQSILERQIE